MPVLPKAKAATGVKGGRKEWQQGDKLWNNMIMHGTPNFLLKYLGVPTFNDDGDSSAVFQGLGEAQIWANPDSLVQRLTFKSTELINRPATGLSELAGCIECTNQVFVERPSAFGNIWKSLYAKYELDNWVKILNSYAYPKVSRTPEDLAKAVQQFLKFLGELRASHYEALAQEMAASATKTVGLAWALEAASLTIPGTWAERLSSIKTGNEKAQKLMSENPHSGSNLRNFLAEEVKHLANARGTSSAAAAPASAAAPLMVFSDDEETPPAPPCASGVSFKKLVEQVMELQFPKNIQGKPNKARRIYEESLDLKSKLPARLEKWRLDEPDAAAAFDQSPVKQHLKMLKRSFDDAFGEAQQ